MPASTSATTVCVGGRHAGGDHHLLAERLGALELRGRRAGAEAGDSGRGQAVGETGHERRLGPGDDELEASCSRAAATSAVDVVSGDRQRRHLGRDAGVAGRAQQPRALRRARQGVDERVLTGAPADDEDARARGRRRHSDPCGGSAGDH